MSKFIELEVLSKADGLVNRVLFNIDSMQSVADYSRAMQLGRAPGVTGLNFADAIVFTNTSYDDVKKLIADALKGKVQKAVVKAKKKANRNKK